MYLKLTDHCKMTCKHCCEKSGPTGKRYMTKKTFRQALAIAEQTGQGLFLGGGEPTDHPDFIEFLVDVLSSDCEIELSGCITNGSNPKEAKLLYTLTKAGAFYAELSQDQYHDTDLVDHSIIDLFESIKHVRTNRRLIKVGRAKNIKGVDFLNSCICEEIWVDIDGTVFQCGCKKVKLGNIFDSDIAAKIEELIYSDDGYSCSEVDDLGLAKKSA